MRNFKLFSFVLMAGMFLFLGGCQKDQEEKYKNKYVSTVTQNSEPIQEYVGLSKVLNLERYFRKNQQYFNSRSGIELDTSCISIVKFDDFYTTYSLNILKKKEGAIQNLIFVESNGVLSTPTIIEFQGTRKFVEDFNNRTVSFDKFEGTITQYTLSSFLNEGRNDAIDCDCFKDYIKPLFEGSSNGVSTGGASSEQVILQLGSYGFGNLGHGANAGQIASQAGSISDILNNLNNSIICPPGTYPVYYLGIKFCKPEYYAGGGGGSNNGEQETFNNDNIGSRTTTEECIKLTKGFGITTGESGLIQPFTATNDPITNQIFSCFNNPAIMQKIEELSQMEITDACKNQKIDIKVDELALDLCFGCGKEGDGLTPQSLEEAYYEALDGVDYITKFQQEKLILMLDGTGLEISDLCDDAPDYDLNSCEKKLLEKYGSSAKMGLYASKKIAEKWASLKFNTLGHNDCLDAFRHAMFNANNAFYLGSGVAKEFGDAHECDNSPTDYFEGVMDLHNNSMGITIYNYLPKNPNGSIPTHILAEEICKRMQNGDLKVFLDPNNNQSPLIPSQNCKCN